MEIPKLYRKFWIEIDASDADYYQYIGARRVLREDKSWFLSLEVCDTWCISDHILLDIENYPKEYVEYALYKNPFNYDCRNIGCYDRPPIRKKEPEPIDTSINGIDFDSDIPF